MHVAQPEASAAALREAADHGQAAWYPLQTRYQCEKKVDAAPRDRRFKSFAPMQLVAKRWSDRTKVVDTPLFPGYMLVRMIADPGLLSTVARLPGLVRFVTPGRELVAVTDAEMTTQITRKDILISVSSIQRSLKVSLVNLQIERWS